MGYEVLLPNKGLVGAHGYDGTGWVGLHVDGDGNLYLVNPDGTTVSAQLYGWDGTEWQKVAVDTSGDVAVDLLTIAEGQVKLYGKSGATWYPVLANANGELSVNVLTAPVTEVKCYAFNGASWQSMIADLTGRLRTVVESVAGVEDLDIATIADGQIKLYGRSGAAWYALACDTSGRLTVNVNAVTTMPNLTVAAITEGQIKNYVYDGASWRRQLGDASGYTKVDYYKIRGRTDVAPMHYYTFVRQRNSFTVTAGQNYVDASAVGGGNVWKVTHCAFWNADNVGTSWNLVVTGGSTNTAIRNVYSPTAGKVEIWDGELWLVEGEKVRFQSAGATVGDVIYLDVMALVALSASMA